MSFLQIDRSGSVNVSKLSVKPHVTAGAGGFVDITARAKKIVFSGFFNAGAKLDARNGRLTIEKEGKVQKLVAEVEHVSFSGRRAVTQGQDITYITERCVMKLTPHGVMVTEIAPGANLENDVLAQAGFKLNVANNLKIMPANLFHPEPFGLSLQSKRQMSEAAE
jgi:acyl CoA:acetate/3-ketoacid CoA transferase